MVGQKNVHISIMWAAILTTLRTTDLEGLGNSESQSPKSGFWIFCLNFNASLANLFTCKFSLKNNTILILKILKCKNYFILN